MLTGKHGSRKVRGEILRYFEGIALVDVVTGSGRVNIYVELLDGESLPIGATEEIVPLTNEQRTYARQKAKAAAEEFLKQLEPHDANRT